MAKFANGQTCLENRGITARHEQMARSDYNQNDPYSATHSDAISNGDPQGKSSGHGGHTHSLPDCTKPTTLMDYSNFDTRNFDGIGGQYDIEGYNGRNGRNQMLAMQMYNQENEYGLAYIDTSLNRAEGQYSTN